MLDNKKITSLENRAQTSSPKKSYWLFVILGIVLPYPTALLLVNLLEQLGQGVVNTPVFDPFLLSIILPALVIYFIFIKRGQKYAVVAAGIYIGISVLTYICMLIVLGLIGIAIGG